MKPTYYDKCAQDTFATVKRPTGYFGETVIAELHFDKQWGKVIEVHDCGCFDSILPPVTSVEEAFWLIENNPHAKKFYTLIKQNEG